MKNGPDIVIGNLVGANITNMLLVFAVPGFIHPRSLPNFIFTMDFPIMIAFTVVLYLLAFGYRKPGRINRWEGAGLLLGFIGFLLLLYFTHH